VAIYKALQLFHLNNMQSISLYTNVLMDARPSASVSHEDVPSFQSFTNVYGAGHLRNMLYFSDILVSCINILHEYLAEIVYQL